MLSPQDRIARIFPCITLTCVLRTIGRPKTACSGLQNRRRRRWREGDTTADSRCSRSRTAAPWPWRRRLKRRCCVSVALSTKAQIERGKRRTRRTVLAWMGPPISRQGKQMRTIGAGSAPSQRLPSLLRRRLPQKGGPKPALTRLCGGRRLRAGAAMGHPKNCRRPCSSQHQPSAVPRPKWSWRSVGRRPPGAGANRRPPASSRGKGGARGAKPPAPQGGTEAP